MASWLVLINDRGGSITKQSSQTKPPSTPRSPSRPFGASQRDLRPLSHPQRGHPQTSSRSPPCPPGVEVQLGYRRRHCIVVREVVAFAKALGRGGLTPERASLKEPSASLVLRAAAAAAAAAAANTAPLGTAAGTAPGAPKAGVEACQHRAAVAAPPGSASNHRSPPPHGGRGGGPVSPWPATNWA